jgi:hypothetical protein
LVLKTENALLFDSVFALANAIKEAEKSLDFRYGNVSCNDNKALKYGTSIGNYLDKVSITGLTGYITFDNRKRRDFELEIIQLRESGIIEVSN